VGGVERDNMAVCKKVAQVKGTWSHLSSLSLESLEYSGIGRFGKARGISCFFIILIPNAHSLRAVKVRASCGSNSFGLPIVEGISKWFVYTS